ncbi:MAG: TrkH family potassium uptake protein [Gammaproteobacteria bacterium]
MRRFFGLLERLGKLAVFFGALMCLPAVVSWIYEDGLAEIYLTAAAQTAGGGLLCALLGARFKSPRLGLRDGFLLVALIWTLLPAIGALPLMRVLPELSFTRAYFEAASGLTATGATVLSGIDDLPPSLNFWRGEMIWLGGMGLIVLVVAVLPALSAGNAAMMQTELPGPAKDERLTPQIAQTAKTLWLTYAALTVACAAAYFAAGMSPLDAVIHAFTTLGLGGFSSHDKSYAYFDSPLIEAVAIVFMVVAGINFVLHFLAWKRKTPRLYWRSLECRAYLLAVCVSAAAVVFCLRFAGEYGWADAARFGIFNAVSVVTTTGYSNADYGAWPLFAPLLMLILANFVSCGGSTGGGVKMQRTLLALYQTGSESDKSLHPQAYYSNKAAPSLPQKHLVTALFFILAYFGTAAALMLALAATGMDFITAFSAALATISNTGPGLGEVGPASNYGWLSPVQTWLCAASMLVGRLELISFLILLRFSFWRY